MTATPSDAQGRGARCPTCGGPLAPATVCERQPRRFCSDRCQMVDLGRWLTGGFAIPGEKVDPSTLDLPEDEG